MSAGRFALLGALMLATPARAAFGPEERLTTNTTVAETGLNHGALAVDSWGRVTAAWAEADGPNGNFRIHTRTRDALGIWGAAELAVDFLPHYAGNALGAKFPALAVLPGDSLLVAWHDYRHAGILNCEIYAKVRGPGAAWGDTLTEIRLTTTNHPETLGDNSYVPNLAVDPAGTAHVAWYDYRYDADHAEILFKSRTGGAFDTTPGDAPDTNLSSDPAESQFPALVAGPDGSLHLAWRDDRDGVYRILHRRRDPAGVWGGITFLSPPGVSADGVTLAVAPDGVLLAAWSDTRTGGKAIFARERSAAGVWGPPRRVSPDGVGAEEAAAAVGPDGRRHLAWQDARVNLFNREVFHQEIAAGAAWDSTGASDTRLSDGSGRSARPTILVDDLARVFVLWQDERHGPAEIYFRASATPTGAEPVPAPSVLLSPNPFRGALHLSGLADVERILVLDVRGRRTAELVSRDGIARWDGRTAAGAHAPAGLYFLRDARSGAPLGKAVRLR